jgi:hypothetical protein
MVPALVAKLPLPPKKCQGFYERALEELITDLQESVLENEAPWRSDYEHIVDEARAEFPCLIVANDGRILGDIEQNSPGIALTCCSLPHEHPHFLIHIPIKRKPGANSDGNPDDLNAPLNRVYLRLYRDDAKRVSPLGVALLPFEADNLRSEDAWVDCKTVVLARSQVSKLHTRNLTLAFMTVY